MSAAYPSKRRVHALSDVSTSFKRLQAEKLAADKVLQELTPVQTLRDVDGLRDYLQNFTLKVEVCRLLLDLTLIRTHHHILKISQDEIRRLNGKLTRMFFIVQRNNMS